MKATKLYKQSEFLLALARAFPYMPMRQLRMLVKLVDQYIVACGHYLSTPATINNQFDNLVATANRRSIAVQLEVYSNVNWIESEFGPKRQGNVWYIVFVLDNVAFEVAYIEDEFSYSATVE